MTITNVVSELMRMMKIHSKRVLGTIGNEIKPFGSHGKSSFTTALLHLHFGVIYRT